MALKYYVRKGEKKLPNDGGTETYYVAQAMLDGKIEQQTIVERLVEKTSLSEGDILSCVTELFKEITSEMLEGHSVKMDNFGTFSLSIRAKSQATEAAVTANTIERCHVGFRPSTRWYDQYRNRVRYQKVDAPAKDEKAEDDDDNSAGGGTSPGPLE